MPFKVIFGYGFNDVGPYRPGFSEVHYYLGSGDSTQDLALNNAVIQLMNARTQIMGSNVRATMYRISVPGQPRRSNTVYATPLASGSNPLSQYPAVSQGTSDIPNTSLKVTCKSGKQNVRNMYLAGLPDVLIQTGVPTGPNFAATGLVNYQALWNQWANIMTGGNWGFRCLADLPAGQPGPISFWRQSIDAPFNLQFILPNTAAYKPSVGDIVHIRGVLMGVTGTPRPIGKWKVIATGGYDANNTFFELDQSSGYQAVLIQMPGTVEQVVYNYLAYVGLGNYLQTSRRRGVGPVRPRGRSKRPARRQPV